MSKKTPVKKSKRRLKRSVRRSLAAVLMITAIAVAAIPVPENAAAGDDSGTASQDTHTVYSYAELKTGRSDADGSEINDAALSGLFDEEANQKAMLEKYVNYLDDPDNPDNPSITVEKSLKIFDNGSEDELTWEYKYYESGSNVVLCDYNDRYPRGKVDLEPAPYIEYFKVSAADFNKYFDEKGGTTIKSDTLTIQMDVDPYEKEVTYSYNDYKNQATFELSGDAEFFRNYAQTAFDLQTAAYKQYDTDYASWEKEKSAYESANSGSTYDKQAPTKPADLKGTMSSIIGNDSAGRLKFFCDHCKTLATYGTGYTLKAVRDTTGDDDETGGTTGDDDETGSTTGDATYAYVAYGGTPTQPGVINVNGYMVTRQGKYVSAIGKHAFKDVGNVENITLPALVHYIGDEAFIHCNSVTTLHIENVELIGNRAFQSCNNLSTITMGSGVKQIGVECFEGCANLSNITFSPNTAKIGAGAFANCKSLSVLNLNNIVEPCEIGAAAFYDCAALTEVSMAASPVTKIGDSAFACISGDRLTQFTFPADIADSQDSLGNRLFCNRAALKTVVFPKNYGRNKSVTIPESMFHGCSQLSCVEFPTEKGADATACANLKYATGGVTTTNELFADVVNKDFYVCGPKEKTNGDAAAPRESTWMAVTKAYGEPGYVPYLYYENGEEYYEICSDNYLECIKKNSDGTGTLISCTLRPGATGTGGTLTIPDQVGDTKVVAIDTNCFTDTTLTKSVRKLIINDNIKTIAPSTFENVDGKWTNLREVTIGSAVESIGERAFYDCDRLTDITFKTPDNEDYSKLAFPDSALKTNGSKLTIHGDIKEGYRPFEYAIDPATYVKDGKAGTEDGTRVCYQSRWDSPESKHMTVMYGESSYESADGKTAYVTLLDYPKYSELEDIDSAAGAELKQHCLEREQEFYDEYAAEGYDSRRIAFAQAWDSAGSTEDVYKAVDASGDPLYGPWINADFCAVWDQWKDGNPNNTAKSENGHLFDWLFEPLTVQAANTVPEPYFDRNPFNFMTNYKDCDGYEDNIPRLNSTGELMNYMGWNDFEKQIISSVEDIVIPAGVESIDTKDFWENNRKNYNLYIAKAEYVRNDDTVTDDTTVPGLFSGWIEDYEINSDERADYEKQQKGNDRIKSVTMTSVRYLPDYAFDNCERLSKVTLGDAMENVGALPFRDCGRLVDLTGNSKYPAENGILYEKLAGEDESYKIVECLLARGNSDPIADRTVTQLSDPKVAFVSEIAESAFEDCNSLSVIDFSTATTLKTIPEGCFKDCKNLTSVILPVSVNDIQDNAFAGVSYESPQDPRCTIEIPGVEVSISDDAFGVDSEYAPQLTYAKERIKIKTFDDTAAYRYATYYKKENMQLETYPDSENVYSVVFMDYDGTQIGDTQYITNDFAEEPDTTELEKDDHRPGFRFTGEWIGTNSQQLNKKISQSCIFIAQYESDGSTVNGKYTVEFYDSISSESLKGMGCTKIGNIYSYLVDAGKSMNDMEPAMSAPSPSQEGYKFKEWKDANGNTWSSTEAFNETIINSNMRVMAMYTVDSASSSNNSTNTSGNTTNTSNNANTSNQSSSTSSSSTSSSTSSSSTSTSSTTSGSDAASTMYTVTVENGDGSGSYAVGSTVIIAAHTPAEGMVFQKWTTESNGVTLASVSMPATTFIMPANNVTVTANYVAGSANTPAATSTSGTGSGGSTTGNNGNTTVDITKPGISNKDLATANVNGSTDNFIVKISETDEATQAVAAALTNKYGSLDNILYYAMDITLWDSTGTYQLTGDQVAGLSVDITIPIPDALVAYGGNNMAGAVINGNQLENLNENFTTINGVPCIRFTATHFSPYTVYVDTGNLTEGMLDVTPKTGDPIHPKWFLSIGLACLSIILFMKKDKKAKMTTK